MRAFLTSGLLFVFVPLFAGNAEAQTLTAAEQADGWLMLFDGETTFGWTSSGDVTVKDGRLIVGGKKPASATTTAAFAQGEWRFQYRHVGDRQEAEARMKGPSRGLPAGRDKSRWIDAIVRVHGGSVKRAFESQRKDKPDWLDDLGDPKAVAPISFATGADSVIEIRDIKFRPLQLTSLFNGKNLEGWKQFAGDANRTKSKFTVTQQGWLNVQNGPGDLQTEGQWSDFLLQLECISHGKHLNSGIFFRCLPGQYQQGYEAQIRNEWHGDDRSKPVDFGTGAIYRRQPARRVVSSDHAWFTMTIIARGNRLAIWVNGHQTVDFADERPAHENPRNGAKIGKGCISIQGHDPTTNLSFRNLRIADYSHDR